jgi:hypothetical protein
MQRDSCALGQIKLQAIRQRACQFHADGSLFIGEKFLDARAYFFQVAKLAFPNRQDSPTVLSQHLSVYSVTLFVSV